MIIVSPGITRNFTRLRIAGVFIGRVIVKRDHDHRTCRWKKVARIGAFIGIAVHPVHLTLVSAIQPFLQSRALGRERFSAHDPHLVEAGA